MTVETASIETQTRRYVLRWHLGVPGHCQPIEVFVQENLTHEDPEVVAKFRETADRILRCTARYLKALAD